MYRWVIAHSHNPRPVSYPYISGDGFRALAQHRYEGALPDLEPSLIKNNEIVFVGDSNIKRFLKEVHPAITSRYIIISHNGDENIDEQVTQHIDDTIIKWYGINVIVKHPKVVPIPLGIENLYYYTLGIPSNFNRVRTMDIPKQNRIFYAFTVGSNVEKRQPALDCLSRHPLAETLQGEWMTFRPYLRLLAKYKFTASPEGSSIEGHRAWDALYVKVSPIVTKSVTTDYFSDLQLPIWVVTDWHALDGVDAAYIENKYKELWKNFDQSKLFMDYWINKIMTHS